MPKITMTGTQSVGGDWVPLPAADYNLQIDAAESGTSKGSGAPQLRVNTHVVDGPFAEKKAMLFYSLKPNSIWKVKALLVATGIEFISEELDEVDPETNKPLETITFDSDDLIGCSFRVTVSQRDYQGKMQNDFNKERALEGVASQPARTAAPAEPARAVAQPARAPAQPAASAPARQRRTTGAA